MGVYEERVLPRVMDAMCGAKAIHPLRQRVCEGLAGDVVEIGFGSGRNVPFYPRDVTKVAAVEPADMAWRIAGKRVAASSVPVERSGRDGQDLPYADESFDCAVSTWSLCTIPDATAALLELRRVLKPGGGLHFVEPVWKRVAGGCHLTRPIADLLTSAGFTIIELDDFYEKGAPKFAGAESLGIAISP